MKTVTKFLRIAARTALAASVLSFACTREDVIAQKRAQETWRRHELVVEAAARGEPVDLKVFWKAVVFFNELTGITIPGEHSPLIDWMPNKDTASALQPLRRWYEKNKDRLYWDDQSKRVRLSGD
jgi:hypothetical protein